MSRRNRRKTIGSFLAGSILLGVGLVHAADAPWERMMTLVPSDDLRRAADLPSVRGMPGWRRYEAAAFEVNVPADWLYSRNGELIPPRSIGGLARVTLIPYLPRCAGEMGSWKIWLRNHVEGTHRKKLRVDENPALTEERMVKREPVKWVSTYVGVEKIDQVFQFLLEVYQGDPQLSTFVRIYRQMLRSLQLHPKALEEMLSGEPYGHCNEEDNER